MDSGFLFRRFGFLTPCVLKQGNGAKISLTNKHSIAAFEDVYLNPFYWQALQAINFNPQIVFDLGANHGYFTSLCQLILKDKYDVADTIHYLIEANKDLITKLHKNKTSLLPNSNIKLKHGVAGPKENVFFNTNNKNLLASKISKSGKVVNFIDLESLPNPDLIKVDIEGAEEILLLNFSKWLFKAKAIIIEFHYDGEKYKKNKNDLIEASFELKIDKLEKSGYRNQLWVRKGF